MMGIKDRSFSALPRNISLEGLVPKETSTGVCRVRSTSPL